MAATDSTANNKAGADKKPGADQSADKKAASDAAALAKKLHDDSHPAPKAADKPASPAPAVPTAPPDANSAPVDSPKSNGLLGWLSSTKKSASAAISNEANQLKETVTADLKSVKAAASSVLATGETTVAKAESTLAKFGTLKITGLTETAGYIEQTVKHTLRGKSEDSVAKDTDAPKTKASNELAGAANKQAQTGSKAVPAAAADSPAAQSSEASQATGLLSSFASVAKSFGSYAEGKVKSALDDVVGIDTANTLINVAETYGGTLTFGAGAVFGTAVLPAMVATAGNALKYYDNCVGDGTFDKGALKVASLKDMTYDSLDAGKQKSDDAIFAKAASYFIMGDAAASGAASIASNGIETTAEGKTKDGINYKVSSTPDKQKASVGAFDLEHYLNVTSASNGDMKITRTPPITQIETKDNVVITYNEKTKDLQMSDKATGYFFEKDLSGIVTTLGGTEFVQANQGKIEEELKKALKTGVKMRLLTDADGDKGFLLADGTKYLLSKAEQKATLEQGDFRLVIYGPKNAVQLFHKNAAGVFVSVEPNATALPKGWQIDGNTVKLNGSIIKATGDSIVKLPGAILNVATGFTADTAKGPVSLTSDGKHTQLSAPDGTKVEAAPDGTATITQPGKEVVNISSKGVVIKDQYSVGTIDPDGSGKLLDLKTGQEADIDSSGNEKTYNAQHQQMFAMNNQGDMTLADGTKIFHTGAVINTSRNINEPSYNGKSADEVVREAATVAASVSSYVGGGGGMGASLASLESTLAMLDSLGDVPGLAEQIGAAKGNIQAKIVEVKNKEFLNTLLSQSGKDTTTIEKAFSMRGAGLSDRDIAERIIRPQDFAAQGVAAS